jgi:hypothetical protein
VLPYYRFIIPPRRLKILIDLAIGNWLLSFGVAVLIYYLSYYDCCIH